MIFGQTLDYTEWNQFLSFINNVYEKDDTVTVIDRSDEIMSRRLIVIGEKQISVIFGVGSFGYHSGKLEMWDYDEEDPTGGHTAIDVVSYINKFIQEKKDEVKANDRHKRSDQ